MVPFATKPPMETQKVVQMATIRILYVIIVKRDPHFLQHDDALSNIFEVTIVNTHQRGNL